MRPEINLRGPYYSSTIEVSTAFELYKYSSVNQLTQEQRKKESKSQQQELVAEKRKWVSQKNLTLPASELSLLLALNSFRMACFQNFPHFTWGCVLRLIIVIQQPTVLSPNFTRCKDSDLSMFWAFGIIFYLYIFFILLFEINCLLEEIALAHF